MILDARYDVILSLGDWCGPSHNIRTHFKTTRAFPFDWWITHYQTLTKLLEQDFDGVFEPANLIIRPDLGGVYCTRYGTVHAHDFAKHGSTFLPDLAIQVPDLQRKYSHLIRRMDESVSDRTVLCVRQKLNQTGEAMDPAQAVPRAKTVLALLRARWPTARIDLLVVDAAPTAGFLDTGHGRIAFDTLDRAPEPGQWQSKAWKLLFERQNISLTRAQLMRGPQKLSHAQSA